MEITEITQYIRDAIEFLAEYPLIRIAFILFAAWLVERLVRRYIGKIIRRAVQSHKYESKAVEKQREDTLISILATAGAVIIWLIAVILILSTLEVDIAALATGAGLLGVVVGFGAQSSVKDFLAGIFIIAENQYRVGDVVSISGKAGVVEEITIRVTRLRDLDGNLHIVPNGNVDVVTNMTFGHANVHLNVGVSYDSDLDKVIKVMNDVGEALSNDEEYADKITEPVAFLRIDSFDDSAVTIKALGQVTPGNQWEIAGEYRRRLKAAFDKNGIEIPFPQRVIHYAKDSKK